MPSPGRLCGSLVLPLLIPQAKNHAVAMVEKQVMFADPKTRQVVAVVTEHQ